jgi:Fe-S-cluster containining protein
MNCLECHGACCETFEIPIGGLPLNSSTRWLVLHGTLDRTKTRLSFECRCTALSPEGLCSIYDNRPLPCRVFTAGGRACLETVRKRRTPEEYARIRGPQDPERIHDEAQEASSPETSEP